MYKHWECVFFWSAAFCILDLAAAVERCDASDCPLVLLCVATM